MAANNLKNKTRESFIVDAYRVLLRSKGKLETLKDLCQIFEGYFPLTLTYFGIVKGVKKPEITPAFFSGPASEYPAAAAAISYNPECTCPGKLVLVSGEYYYTPNVAGENLCREWKDTSSAFGFRSILIIPILNKKKVEAILGLYSEKEDLFSSGEIRQFLELSEDISELLFSDNRSQKEDRLQGNLLEGAKIIAEQKEKEIILNQFSKGVVQSLSEDEIISSVQDSIYQALTPDMIMVFLRDNKEFSVHKIESYGNNINSWKAKKLFRDGECLCGITSRENRAIYTSNIFKDKKCTLNTCKLAGVRSFAAIPLTANGINIGIIGVASSGERNFKQYSTFLETLGIQGAIGIANARLYREVEEKAAQLEVMVKTKDTLLKEIHHRIKNNLNVIESLLSLQLNEIEKGGDPKDALVESKNRLFTMSQIHEKLYQTDNFSEIEMSSYIEVVVRELVTSYNIGGNITINTDVDPVTFSMASAVPFGLLLNEILTNTMKYAFPGGREGQISVVLKKRKGIITFKVKDNGVGIPPSKLENSESLGLTLIRLLTNQLDGTLSIDGSDGTEISIEFPHNRQLIKNKK